MYYYYYYCVLYYIVFFNRNYTHEYSYPSVCLRACLSVCVCVCLCTHDNSESNGSIHLQLEHIVVYGNSTVEFDIGHCVIKVKVTA